MDSVDDIYLTARELTDATERAGYLDQACGADVGLRERVEAMLRDAAGAEAFFRPVEEATVARSGAGDVGEAPGTVIGRYRLVTKLGEGGMGVVYRAEQREPVRRQVALKIIKPGMDTRQVVTRFEAERQTLALMDHPNIAKVLDGGVTGQRSEIGDQRTAGGAADSLTSDLRPLTSGSGRPYFVMELVEGVPITEFCATHELSLEQRLRLFIPVCQAVQHAHQKGIIHRDLKPSNVMVTVQDGVPVPKVIDFGVAKAVNQRLTEKTLFTQHATLIGTPAYMSPEQAELSGVDVDTRSDIYSLGVLLYELLTGTQPFPEQRLRSVAYAEMQRIILHEEPERPSTRLSRSVTAAVGGARLRPSRPARMSPTGMSGTNDSPVPSGDSPLGSLAEPRPTATAAGRPPFPVSSGPWPDGTGPWPGLPRRVPTRVRIAQLRGDLDWIVLKCLEKDRNRRYETANGLAADLLRFLNNEPVVARPPSAGYRLQKALRRNQLAFTAAGVVALTLVGGSGATYWQARRAGEERARAERRLHATVELMNAAFTNVMPALRHTIGATKPREYLAKTATGIVQALLRDGEPDPEMRRVVGQLYLQLAMVEGYYTGATTGEYDEALESARKAIQFFQPTGAEGLNDGSVDRLIWAEMCAGFAAQGLLRFEDALDHFGKMRAWSVTLAQSSNPDFADRGHVRLHWAQHLTGETVFRMGQAEVAVRDYFLPLVDEIKRREVHDEAGRWQVAEDLRDAYDAVGRCFSGLGQKEPAEGWFRQALPLAEALAESHPSHAGYACYAPLSKARLGEVLLALARPDEALPLLASATQSAEMLQQRDPGNPGFVQLEVEVLQCYAAGYAGWAEDPGASAIERAQRLDQAEACLDQAEGLVATLKSESFRTFLCDGLLRTAAQLRESRARFLLPERKSASP